MAIVIVDDGTRKLLDEKLAFLSTLEVRLFKNNYTPTRASLTANFVQADFDGYSSQVQTFGAPAVDNTDGTSTATGTLITFTPTGTTTPNDIYGYYVVDPADADALVYAERFSGAPFAVGGTMLQFAFYPTFSEGTM